MHSRTPVSVLLHATVQETVAWRAPMSGVDHVIGNPTHAGRQPIQHIEAITDAAYAEDAAPVFPLSPPGAHRLIKGAETPRSATWGLSGKVTDAIDRTERIARFGVRAVGGGQLPGADAPGLPGPPEGAPLGGVPVGAPLGGPPPSGAPPPPPGALPPVGSVLVSMGTVSFAV